MIKKTVGVLAAALMVVPASAAIASAQEPVQTNVKEKVECMFRVYIQEGGEQGLECLF